MREGVLRMVACRARSARSAFTLLEILLVLAIIVLVAAMLFPSFESLGSSHRMTAALDEISGAWTVARSQAIEDSRPYRFAVSGSHYRVAPDSDEFFSGALPAPDPNNPVFVQEGALSRGVTFVANGQDKTTVPDDVGDQKPGSAGNWKRLTVFYPDGTASDDVDIALSIPGTRSRSIRLRSLTGTIEFKTEGEENR
jgi:prepilin-type N-terminal cleavage/methylation domain-containing protein